MSTSSDEELDNTQIHFQEAHGARLFRQGKPRAVLEVKSPNIPKAIYEARLRGYDRVPSASDQPTTTNSWRFSHLALRHSPRFPGA